MFSVVFDGLSKREAPGSLWEPEPTQWVVWGKIELGTAFGLFMAGVGAVSSLCTSCSGSDEVLPVFRSRGNPKPGKGYGRTTSF